MKSYLFGAVSVISLIAAGSASAHDDDGWYLRGNAGYGIHEDAQLTGGIDSSFHGNGLQSEGDDAFSLGVGYDFGDNWRIEADGDTLNTSLGSISQTPGSLASLTTESIMLNALYDFDDFGKFEPFVGGGIGFVRSRANLAAHDFPSPENTLVRNPTCVGTRTAGDASTCDISDEDTGFGWQLLAGLGYKVTDNLTWDTHYTYLNAPESDLDGFITNSATAEFEEISAELSDVAAHTVMTGLRYTFGHDHAPQIVEKLTPPPPPPTKICWDNSEILASAVCPDRPVIQEAVVTPPPPPPVQTYECWDRTVVTDLATCPPQPPAVESFLCSDNQTVVTDLSTCPVQRANLNLCSESSVAIFNVPQSATPKQVSRLGTMPEFGNSHGLSSDEFYQKLDARYNSNATDKAYLNYLFKSMGYSNGWADAQSYMFSEETLPVGTRGLLGLGEVHHYEYSILPADEKDRQAFRIQSANGSVVHFMKTCGNYMYACE